MTNIVCNAVTRRVSHGVSNGRRTTVQNQSQNQTLYRAVGGICGYDSIHRLGLLGAAAGNGWML